MSNKEHIEQIIKHTFSRLDKAYQNQREGINKSLTHIKGESRIVFPCYGERQDNEIRISEQELRFAFVEAFNTYCDEKNLKLFYSIETPTRDTYSGFANKKEEPKPDHNGRSAEFDLVIYDEHLNRIALVEFKALNADEHDHWKDFVKLNNPNEGGEDVLRYFIEVIKSYTENGENSTVESLKGKLKRRNQGDLKASFFCYALEGKSTRGNNASTGDKNISNRF